MIENTREDSRALAKTGGMRGRVTFQRYGVQGREYILASLESVRPQPAYRLRAADFRGRDVPRIIAMLIGRSAP